MRLQLPILALSICLGLFMGCATSTFSTGRDFDMARVQQISKGKTTSAEMIAWFKEPVQRTVTNDGAESWTWTFTTVRSHAQSYVLTMDVKTQTNVKRLTAVLRDGVVETYSFTEGPPV
jgi:hypothetical protein